MFKKTLYFSNNFKNINKIDYTLLWVVLILLAFGVVMIYSATSTNKMVAKVHSNYYYLYKQCEFIIGILIFCLLLSLFPMRFWFKYANWFIIGSVVVLLSVLCIGSQVGITRRWIHLVWFNIQPSEFFKLTMIIFLSSFITINYSLLHQLKFFKTILILPVVGMFLVCIGGDLGSSIILFSVFIFTLFISGIKKIWITIIIIVAFCFLLVAIYMAPYRFNRVMDFFHLIFNSDQDSMDINFQIKTAFKAISTGGIIGVGLGNSVIAKFYLPEVHTDFIFAFIIEELGLIVGLIIITIYLWICWKGSKIAKRAYELEEYFSFFLARGICCLMVLQAGIHIGVNIGLFPSTGLTLPFISYGGSSLLVNLVSITFLLKIDYENKRKMRGYKI